MKIRIILFFSALILTLGATNIFAQTDTYINQITRSNSNTFAGGISGDGRLIVFESTGDLDTENPRNADRNREIFVFDYAQRRIYQITDTKSVLKDTVLPPTLNNIKVLVDNTRPVISNDGKWIAFSSNATTSIPGSPVNGTNPGNFDGNTATNSAQGADPLELEDAEDGDMLMNIVQPGGPTVVRIQITDVDSSISAFSVSVVGTDANNNELTETFTFENGLIQVGTQTFSTITSVTLNSVADANSNDTLSFGYGDGTNILTNDANMETWLFTFQNDLPPVDLSQGTEISPIDLSAGTFTQVTNTPTSRVPREGSTSTLPLVASDNVDPSISDDGNAIAFVSNRNLVGNGNEAPQDNPEIFTYIRNSGTTSQVTQTNRGQIFAPLYNNAPTISGNGMRVMFASNADNPVVGMTGGNNTDINEEVFYADLNAAGAPSGNNKQVTTTTPENEGFPVNLINFGRRMSRDGKYMAFDSFADLTNEDGGAIQDGFTTFLYDADTDTFQRLLDRSDSDAAAFGGDIARYPTFTDYVGLTPQTVVMQTRMNILPTGIVATEEGTGLNQISSRPSQVYSFPINAPKGDDIFSRLTFLPPPTILATMQIFTSNVLKRTALSIPSTEIGTGNQDSSTEVYYLLTPEVTTESEDEVTFETATGQTVSNDPVPETSPSPSPTPETPEAVQGLSAGSLAVVNYDAENNLPAAPLTAEGSFDRTFSLPMELGGVSMSINGVGVGLRRVSSTQITFVVPPGFGSNLEVPFPVVINNNGVEIKADLILVPTRPEVLRFTDNPDNRARVLNATNRVLTREPFDVMTLKYRGGVKVPTVLRLFLTGVEGIAGTQIDVRIGDVPITGQITNPEIVEPGIYIIEFELSSEHEMLGDQPVVISVDSAGDTFFGRLDSDAPRVKIL